MNFVTFVFSLLLIFAFGTFVVLERQGGDRRIRETYLGHVKANRKILSKVESKTYNSLRYIPKETQKREIEKKKRPIPEINPDCSKLNLWPLVQEGKEAQPFLYEMALRLLDTFYGKSLFQERAHDKVLFLNTLLKKLKEAIQAEQLSLEKLSLGPIFHQSYYRMLKGTKSWDPEKELGYPSLLDVIKVEEHPSKICILHAHQGQLIGLFGKKVGTLLFDEFRTSTDTSPIKNLVEEAYSKAHLILPKEYLFDLIDLDKSDHFSSKKTTFFASDEASGVSLRKTIYSPKKST